MAESKTPNPELTFGEALSHAQNYANRVAKPFEKIADVLRTAATAESFAASVKTQLEREVAPLRAEKAQLTAELDAARSACAAECAAKLAAVEEPVRRKLDEAAMLDAEIARKRGEGAEQDAQLAEKRERLRTLAAAVTAAEAIR